MFRRSFSVLTQIKDKIVPSVSVKFDVEMRKKLEHLSLISFLNDETVNKIEKTIHASNIIQQAQVSHLSPVYNLLENEPCPLRSSDNVSKEKTLDVKQVLDNAPETYEDYLVAPMIGIRDSQTVEKMSTCLLLLDRLTLTFVRVEKRLKSLLALCRTNEHPSWMQDDDDGEFYRFCGPYRSDCEELETCIERVRSLIENLRHECETSSDDSKPLPNYPLCANGWTKQRIEQLEHDEIFTPDILNLLQIQTFAACASRLDEQRSLARSHSLNNEKIIWHDHSHSRSSLPIQSSEPTCDFRPNLLDLPSELILHILSFLSPCEWIGNVARTCQLFQTLILTRLYSHLCLSNLLSVFDVPRLLCHLPYLQSLTLVDWEDEPSILSWAIWLEILAHTTSNLRTIRFQTVRVCPILICLIVELFPHCLQTIIFDYQHKAYEKFDLILALLADSNIGIKRVTASYQAGITNFGIVQLVNQLETLVELNLLYIEAINDETVQILCDKHHTHLEVLKIDGAQLTDRALESIGRCRRLRSIMIEFCSGMIGTTFHELRNLHNLEEMCLAKLGTISLEAFHVLFTNNHAFEHIIVLKLGECHLLDDACIQSIVDACPRLIDLTCSWAFGLTDDSFKEIVLRCIHLRRLSLVGCHQIYGDLLNDIPEKYLPHIEYLNFEQCNQIEDDLLIQLHGRKRSITILNYYGTLVDDEE